MAIFNCSGSEATALGQGNGLRTASRRLERLLLLQAVRVFGFDEGSRPRTQQRPLEHSRSRTQQVNGTTRCAGLRGECRRVSTQHVRDMPES